MTDVAATAAALQHIDQRQNEQVVVGDVPRSAQRAHDQVMVILAACENGSQDENLVRIYLGGGERI